MRQQGFTLIELMITLAVIGILSAIAYPMYQQHLRTSARKTCEGVLLSLGSAFEQQYAATGKYPETTGTALPSHLPDQCPPEGGKLSYTITRTVNENDEFEFTATREGDQQNDTCGDLTFNHRGVKGIATGGPGTAAACW